MSDFSDMLARLMREREITQQEIAKGVGIKRQTVSAYIKGLASPTLPVMIGLANYLNISLDYLAGRDEIRRVGLNFDTYQRAAQRTSGAMEWDRKVLNGAMGMAGEAGETIDVVKKWQFQGHALDRGKLIDEAGDCLWYIAQLAAGLGMTLEDIAQHNIDKLWRRYPAGFDSVRSVNRDGGAN